MIKRVLEDIKIAYNNKAYFSALALTLIIPDICGKIQYKNEMFEDFDVLAKFDGEIEEVHRRFNVINLIEAFIDGTEEYIKAYGDTSNEYATMDIIII